MQLSNILKYILYINSMLLQKGHGCMTLDRGTFYCIVDNFKFKIVTVRRDRDSHDFFLLCLFSRELNLLVCSGHNIFSWDK